MSEVPQEAVDRFSAAGNLSAAESRAILEQAVEVFGLADPPR